MRRLALSFALLALSGGCARVPESAAEWHRVEAAPFYVWATHEGRIESRHTAVIMSSFAGGATIISLAPEGAQVQDGDRLVEFDSSAVERELVRQRRDLALARSDLETLKRAKQPMELQELTTALMALENDVQSEEGFLKESELLRADDLVSETELEQQRQRVRQLQARRASAEEELRLTREFLHPSALDRAQATLDAADEALRQSEQQLANCIIRSPRAGTVVHTPLHIGAEYRTVRVGDMVYKNQPFLEIPDFSNLVVRCAVPEAALSGIAIQSPVTVIPVAFPDLWLKGRVDHVGSMAQAEPGRTEWQRFFSVVVALDDLDPRLRTGMSATCQVLSYRNASALSIPRRAIQWIEGSPRVRVKTPTGKSEEREIQTGRANAREFEVLSGLVEGDEVLLP